MCFISTLFRTIPDCPLLVLSNREEMRSRPATPPKVISKSGNATRWLGGIDAQADGTWLGVNEFALVVAVTNRPKIEIPPDIRSRGLLCRDLLECHSLDQALEDLDKQLQHHRFAGFNLLLLTAKRAIVIECGDDYEMKPLCPGNHTITNGTLNDPDDVRILRAQTELGRWNYFDSNIDDMVRDAKSLCGLTSQKDQAGICITGSDWGTVSSTILGLTENRAEAFYRHAPGPPAKTSYDDYSVPLQELLNLHN
jgi:uncharacterized protein with NRDE domain